MLHIALLLAEILSVVWGTVCMGFQNMPTWEESGWAPLNDGESFFQCCSLLKAFYRRLLCDRRCAVLWFDGCSCSVVSLTRRCTNDLFRSVDQLSTCCSSSTPQSRPLSEVRQQICSHCLTMMKLTRDRLRNRAFCTTTELSPLLTSLCCLYAFCQNNWFPVVTLLMHCQTSFAIWARNNTTNFHGLSSP